MSATLTALMAVAKKPSQPSARFAGDETLNNRLSTMVSGWGGKEQGLDLLACVVDDASSIQQVQARQHRLFAHSASLTSLKSFAPSSKLLLR